MGGGSQDVPATDEDVARARRYVGHHRDLSHDDDHREAEQEAAQGLRGDEAGDEAATKRATKPPRSRPVTSRMPPVSRVSTTTCRPRWTGSAERSATAAAARTAVAAVAPVRMRTDRPATA